MSLDSDGDQQIDFFEFKKLRRKFKLASNTHHSGTDHPSLEVESPDQLKPCPNCNLGLWEPNLEEVTGYVLLELRSVGFRNVLNFPGHITVQVPSSISIYGIAQIVKRELGPCTLNVRIFQDTGSNTKEKMAFDKKLREYGITGTLPPEEPGKVTLLYDYDYPLLDCPLLMANFSV